MKIADVEKALNDAEIQFESPNGFQLTIQKEETYIVLTIIEDGNGEAVKIELTNSTLRSKLYYYSTQAEDCLQMVVGRINEQTR